MHLWTIVENAEKSLNACSGCAGDYEDPDRTAWQSVDEESEEAEGPKHEFRGGKQPEMDGQET